MTSQVSLRKADQLRREDVVKLPYVSSVGEFFSHSITAPPSGLRRHRHRMRSDDTLEVMWEDPQHERSWIHKLTEPLVLSNKSSPSAKVLFIESVDRDLSSDQLVERTKSGTVDRIKHSLIGTIHFDLNTFIENILLSATYRELSVIKVANHLSDIFARVVEQSHHALRTGNDPLDLFDEIRNVLANAEIKAAAITEILSTPMMTEEAASTLLALKPENQESVEEYRRRSWLIGLPTSDGYHYPQFQFNEQQIAIYSVVRDVNERLRAIDDPWGVASWWLSPHARLGARPADLVGVGFSTDGDCDSTENLDADIIAASKALLSPVG